MTDIEKRKIAKLREKGLSYGKISKELGISVNTIKTYCKRNGLGGVIAERIEIEKEVSSCDCCGNKLVQIAGRKIKRFCSDRCRNKWWNENLDKVNRKANYDYICPSCKKPFTAYGNAHRKYCSHECYIADRFGGI